DVIGKRAIRAVAPQKPRLVALEIIHDDQVVRCERLGSSTAEFLRDAHLEAAGVFQCLLQDGRGSFPVMAVLTGDNEGLEFRRPGGGGALRAQERRAESGHEEKASSVHSCLFCAERTWLSTALLAHAPCRFFA